MFSFFKKEIKMVCFDVDNTLCDFASAETEAEAYMAELISKDIKKMQLKDKRQVKQTKKRNQKNLIVQDSCSPFTILKTFSEVKKYHLYSDLKPETYSRELWYRATIERLDDTMDLGISTNTLSLNAKSYERLYWEQIIKRCKNYSYTISVLDFLRSKNIRISTITDSDGLRGMKDTRIKNLGLDKYFDYTITGDDVGLNKPAIENWNKLLELSKLRPKQCIMVGDHPDVDLITAKKLGFITVWTKQNINTDLHQKYVDYEIRDIKEIIDIVTKLNG
jgi:HAD superfamily hydrolase (TIGR01549 family)